MRPRAGATSRAPREMKCTEGNLLVTTAIVFGGFPVDSSASISLLGRPRSGSDPSGLAGKCIGYVASLGIPNEWWISILL